MSTTRNALECRLGLGRIALPTEFVDLLGEYSVGTALPLGDRVSYSIGVWGEEPILSISLGQHDAAPMRATRGALIVGTAGGMRCAFEIDEPLGLVQIAELGASAPTAPWRKSATLDNGRTLQFIDVPLLVRELAGAKRA